METFYPIVRNIQNDYLYQYLGDNRYKNLATGITGTVDEEKAQRIFKINLEATQICNEYPVVMKLIEIFKLKIEKQ